MQSDGKSFFDNISIAKKTILLIIVITLGTLLVGVVAHYGVKSMRESYETFYKSNYEPMSKLEKIREYYIIKINDSLDNENYSKTESYKEQGYQEWNLLLKDYYQNIDRDKNGFQPLIDEVQKELVSTNSVLQNLQTREKNSIRKHLDRLDQKISKLLNYYHTIAKKFYNERKDIFDKTQLLVIAITSIIVMLTLLLSLLIARNFKEILTNLANIVEKRNKEYEKIQESIVQKIEKAVKEARQKDQIIYQNARLASMGEMIGNIAHQWRQPLNALTLLIQSFGTKSMTGNLTKEFIDKQVEEGLRLAVSMSNTIEDFRNFFSSNREKEYFKITEAIQNTLDMSTFFLKDEHINIKVISSDDDIKIFGNSNEFSQVLLNLINNARDNFKINNIEDRKIEIDVHCENEYIVLSFIDNGGGIEESIIDRVFEPYFTTKHQSIGTGIGLYMSKQIIETQMNGKIEVKNVKHSFGELSYKSAKFIITLPK